MKVIRNRRRRLMFSGIRVTRSYMAITADVGDALGPIHYDSSKESLFLRLELEGTTIRLVPSNADDKQAYMFSKRAIQPNMYTSSRNTGRTLRTLAPIGDYYWSDHLTFALRPVGESGEAGGGVDRQTALDHIEDLLVIYGQLPTGANRTRIMKLIQQDAATVASDARLDQMSRVRNKANELACADPTLIGSGDLRGYHYSNALDLLTHELDDSHDVRWLAPPE